MSVNIHTDPIAMISKLKRDLAYGIEEYNIMRGKEMAEREVLLGYEAEAGAAEADVSLYNKAQALLVEAGTFARAQLIGSIVHTGSAGLQSILHDKDVRFDVEITNPGGRPSAEWLVRYGDNRINPEDSDGGTVVDIVSLALRCILLELTRPKPQGFVVLDEPGKMVSAEYLPHMAEFIKQYLKKTGRQGIMVTHHPVLAEAAHKAYRVEQDDGRSRIHLIGEERQA